MSSVTGPQTNSGNLFSIGLRLEIANLFASFVVHPLNWYLPRFGYNQFSWAFTFGPLTLTQVDYAKYTKIIIENEKNAAKELVKILEQIEDVSSTAKGKLKDLTSTGEKPNDR